MANLNSKKMSVLKKNKSSVALTLAKLKFLGSYFENL